MATKVLRKQTPAQDAVKAEFRRLAAKYDSQA